MSRSDCATSGLGPPVDLPRRRFIRTAVRADLPDGNVNLPGGKLTRTAVCVDLPSGRLALPQGRFDLQRVR
jgi:hypothetical protein